MTTIGYATLQIIPSLDGVSEAVDKQLGGKLRVMGTQQGKQLSKGFGVGLKDLERDVDSAGRAYQKLKDRAADALGKVRTEEAALKRLRDTGASDDRIIRTEERLATARRNSTRASREATDGHKALEAAQGASLATTVAAGGAFGKLSTLAAGAGTALLSAGAIAGGAALVGVTALAAGVLATGNALYDLGAKFDDTFDNIRIKTGATGPALQQLEDATKRLATNVPLSIGEIGNVVAETSRALHLTGPDLDNVAGSIANLGRLTGENVDVRTLGKAFRGFGVDAKDQVPALDGLFRASQATGVGVNELLATVVKGGAGLRQFGFDFGQSAALATQFEGAGLDADKAMTGLTKGLASMAKDGQTGKQALQDNVTQIKALIAAGNDAGALELTNKLFGAKGGVQFFEAIKNGALDLDTLADSIGNTGDTINKAAQDTDDWSERWQTLKNEIAVALQPIATGVFDSVNSELGTFADWVAAHKPEIIGFFEDLGNIAITAAENFAHGMGGILQAIGDMVGGLGNVKGVLDSTMAFFADLRGDHAGADEFRRSAQEAFGWGESIRAAGDKLANLNLDGVRDGLHNVSDAARNVGTDADGAANKVTGLGTALGALPFNKSVKVDADTGPADVKMQAWLDKWKAVIIAPPAPATPPGPVPSLTDPNRPHFGGRAFGGPITGAGGSRSDIIPIWASNGEHMLSAADVTAMGGQAGVYAFRNALHRAGGGDIKMAVPWGVDPNGGRNGPSAGPFRPWWDMDWVPPEHPERIGPDGKGWWWHHGPTNVKGITGGPWAPPIGKHRLPLPGDFYPGMIPDPEIKQWGFKDGGAIGPDVRVAGELVGTAYDQASRHDCSGMVARVIDGTLGMPATGLMSTKNAKEWLAAHGFKPGIGGPGTISVGWYDHGPNPNDGHMAMTLSDGSNAEAGGGVGDIFQIGGGAAGASDPQFDQHMYLPTVFGEGPAGSASASSPFAGGSAAAAITGGAPAASSSGDGGTSSSSGGSSFSLPSSISDLAAFGLNDLGKGVGATKGGSDLSLFGKAAGAAVSGQVDSALGVLGVNGSPGWLKAISTLVGGISIGGSGSANPLSASPSGTGTPPPDDPGNMHGTRAGQQPGPVYNITARDTEDAFIKAQRLEREKAAAKLSRF